MQNIPHESYARPTDEDDAAEERPASRERPRTRNADGHAGTLANCRELLAAARADAAEMRPLIASIARDLRRLDDEPSLSLERRLSFTRSITSAALQLFAHVHDVEDNLECVDIGLRQALGADESAN